jgi:hypothetical protein
VAGVLKFMEKAGMLIKYMGALGMKKLFIILIILIALGAGCFFAGWAQMSVPHNSYGVLRSKTHGLYGEVITDGKFTWLWYKLIPVNTEISVFNIKNQTIPVEARGVLPQAETYTSFVGLKTSFLWQVSGNVFFTLDPKLLPVIADQFHISNQTELDAYSNELRAQLEPFIEQRLAYYCGQQETLEQINTAGDYKPLTGDIEAEFPYISELSCSLSVKQFPDYKLYNSAKEMYENYISRQREILNSQINANAAGRINSQFRLDELARYGELLTKYPVLLDYLKITGAGVSDIAPAASIAPNAAE